MKTALCHIAYMVLVAIGINIVAIGVDNLFAQNQPPATAPDENAKDSAIVELTIEKKMLKEQLRRERLQRSNEAGIIPSPYPDFVHAKYSPQLGAWVFWLSDTNLHFHLSDTNCLVLKN